MRLLGNLGQPTIPDQIVSAAQQNNVDPVLALNVAQAESNFNQNAVSSAGAIGVMQLLPGTAAQYGADPYNTADNIDAGTAYLGDLINQFGDEGTALAAYNWGPGNVQKAISTYGTSRQIFHGCSVPNWFLHIPSVTQNYVLSILGNCAAFAGQAGAASPPITAVPALPPTSGTAGGLPPVNVAGLLPSNLTMPSNTGTPSWLPLAFVGGFIVILYLANQ